MFEQSRVPSPGVVIELRKFGGAGRIAFEQLAVVSLDDIEMAKQIPGEGRAALVAKKTSESFHRLGVAPGPGPDLVLVPAAGLQRTWWIEPSVSSMRGFASAPSRLAIHSFAEGTSSS